MNCPLCDTSMQVSERESVEIQYCQQCGGIWLQRGALEGIVARVARNRNTIPGRVLEQPNLNRSDAELHDHEAHDRHGDCDDERSHSEHGKHGQTESTRRRPGGIRELLGEIFDFG